MNMKIFSDPRFQKTTQILMIGFLGFWIGQLVTQPTRTTFELVCLWIFVVGIPVFLFHLLRDIWKPTM